MARGTPSGPNADPRWEGQDSLSLPDRPAHPDPSRVADQTANPDEAPTHGIHGFVEHKIGITPEAEVLAARAQAAQAQVDSLEAEKSALETRSQAGGDAGEAAKARLSQVSKSLSAAKKEAGSAEFPEESAEGLRQAILAGEVVPSIEASSREDSQDGKRDDASPGNAPESTVSK